jgi:DNA-binding NarL/FixJ family response regulator
VSALRVVIVDDHPMFRLGLAAAVEQMDGIELVGEAERAADVDALVATTEPDVVLLDIRLPDGSGLEVNRTLAARHPDVRVIVLTMSEDHETVLTALRDGARGYLVKGAGPDQVEQAVRAVAADDVVLNHDLARAPPRPQPEDRAQPRLQRAGQGARHRPLPRHRPRSAGWPRR